MKKLSSNAKIKIWKTLLIVFLLIAIILAIYLPLKLTGTLAKIDSPEKLKEVILSFGGYSYCIFFIIQFLQTTILPIPAAVTTVAGTLIFGIWPTFALSFVAIMLGSLVAFLLGKKVGRKIVVWIAGEKEALKWEEKMQKGKFVFFLMMLLPLFPDDILCIVVGTTNMSFKFFFITNLITRPIGILLTCFLGSGTLIPFSGWGIPVWIILALIVLVMFYLSIRYQQQIENFVVKLGQKMGIKSKKKAIQTENENIEENDDNLDKNEEKDNKKDNLSE